MDFKMELAKFLHGLVNPIIRTNNDIAELTIDDIVQLIEVPADNTLGDYALPCFKLAKMLKKPPNVIANELKEISVLPEFIKSVSVVGAFLNFFLDKAFYCSKVISEILLQKNNYGSSNVGDGKVVVIDYSAPNVAKRFHVGHLYSTLIGNALYKMFNFLGYKSFGINYLGDWGTQFGKLIVAYKNWGDKADVEENGIEALEQLYVKFHDEAEKDASLNDSARAYQFKLQEQDADSLALWKWFVDISFVEYDKQYTRLNIHFDSFLGESFYNDKMPAVVEELKDKNLLVESDGAQIVDLEAYKMPPSLILRRDGGALYPTRDIASALYRKKTYNFYKAVYITDMRQTLHFAQWFKVIELMGYDWANDLIHVPYGLLSLEDGELSSRKGRIILLTDLLDEAVSRVNAVIQEKNPQLENRDEIAEQVGLGAVIFSSLYNSRIKDNVFTLNKALSFDGETGPYVQYTHARAASILEKAGSYDFSDIDFSVLDDASSFEIVKLLDNFQDRVMMAIERYEPFLVSRYLILLSQAFNKFYHDNPILSSADKIKTARLALVYCVKMVISSGLSLLGISSPNKM